MKQKNTISAMGKAQRIQLKKSMSKKAYRELCQTYRGTMTLGRSYGTRQMASARDKSRKRHKISEQEYDL